MNESEGISRTESEHSGPRYWLWTLGVFLAGFAGLGIGALAMGAGEDDTRPTLDDPVPSPGGDDHILSVADGVGLSDLLDDETIIELGHHVCDFLDESGGDFDAVDSIIGRGTDGSAETLQIGVVALAGVPAYCPEWTDELIAWGESGEGW